MEYLPLLIATSTTKGAWSQNLTYNRAFDTKRDFGLYIKHSPFSIMPKPKNIITQTWKDEDGDDVFIPDQIFHEAYEMELEFIYLWEDHLANKRIHDFIETIEGRWLKMYETYTQQGRGGIYLIEADTDPTFKRRANDYVSFKAKFRVNQPDLNIKLILDRV